MQNAYFMPMKVTATELARDSNSILDAVIHRGETAVITRHGKDAVQIRRVRGVSREEILRRLDAVRFSKEEARELTAAIQAGAEVVQ